MTTAATATGPTTSGPTSQSAGATRLVRTLTLTVFLQWMGATAIVPMLPVYVRHLGGSDALAGVVMAAFYAAGVVSQYPVGRITDRIGRRPVLVAGLITYAAATLSFLLPISADVAIALRAAQGVGAGAATVAALAMISGSVATERRGRAFAAVYSGELAGMAVGPLVGSILGIRYMSAMFLASGLLSLVACVPALRLREHGDVARARRDRTRPDGSLVPLGKVRFRPSMTGALLCGAALGLATGVYDICWTLLLLARGASGLEIGISWTLFAVPFVAAAKPSGWLADHTDRRVLVLCGLGLSTVLCASYPFIHSVPILIALGASEAIGFATAMPSLQSLLTQGSAGSEVGRIQGMFATSQTAATAVSAAAAGAAFAVAAWLPFVTVAGIVLVSLGTAAFIWRPVAGRLAHGPVETLPADGPGVVPPADGPGVVPPATQAVAPEPVGVSAEVQ